MRTTPICRSGRLFVPMLLYFVGTPLDGVLAADPELYSQQDRAQAISRDVPFYTPQQIHCGVHYTTTRLQVVETVSDLSGVLLRHRSYNHQLVGPTIRVRPGQTLKVRLENDLPYETEDEHSTNGCHGLNTTNLHTHGLHVSPNCPADDVFLEIRPGDSFNYTFKIPADHPAGTFWYHAHKHGSTAVQLASGMAGALIVEGGLDDVPEIAAARERILVLQQFSYKEIPGEPSVVDIDGICSGEADLIQAINGVVTPTIVMRPGEVERWRIIHAGTSEAIDLDAEGVNFWEVAIDGLTTGRLEQKSSLELYPGYRSDVLVKAPMKAGARLVYTVIRDPEKSIRGLESERANLLRIVVEGDPNDMPLPDESDLAPLAPYTDDDVPTTTLPTRNIVFSLQDPEFYINGAQFDPDTVSHTIQLDSEEEWNLSSDQGVHPFHIHVNPFAVKPENEQGHWIWRDTIAVRRRHPVTIRTRYETFTGKTVLHCHNLRHEDHGMMQAIEIVRNKKAPEGQAKRIAPDWTAVDGEGQQQSSRDYQGKAVLVVLHRGMNCIHCTAQMAKLSEQIEAFHEAGIKVVAISQYLPEDKETLQVLAEYPFPILTDSQLDNFKKFDALDAEGRPMHGLFLVNSENQIVKQLITETAVADPFSFVQDKLTTLSQGD